MDLMFAAEQYAQAQAAAQAVAAAQYYTNMAAAAVVSAGQQPPPPPGSMAAVTAPQNFSPLVTQTVAPPPPPGTSLAAFAPAPPVLSGLQASYLMQQPPLPPKESSSSRDYNEDDREESRESRKDRHRDRDRGRERRVRSRDRGGRSRSRERKSSRRSRSRDRKRRSRSRERKLSRRSRSPRERKRRSRSIERDRDRRDRTPESDEEARNVPPNSTIMIRGLAQHISETDISDDIQSCGLVAKDIRLIRKKETGASRGFAFVEFAKIQDAQTWMDEKKGILMFKDQYRAVMQYSLPRDGRPGEPPRILHDWICSTCGVQNFRRRDQCFKCGGPKSDIDASGEGADEVSPHPTSTVLLRGLDALSTEDAVLNCMMQVTDLPLKTVRIGKDSLTNTSRGVCYVEMNSVVDAMFLHNQLLGEPPTIDDKLVSVSYYRPPLSSHHSHHSGSGSAVGGKDNVPTKAANAALAAAQWSHQGRQGIANQYSHDDIEQMAEYSASLYAKTPGDKAHYLEYYRNYYKNGGDPNAGQRSSPTPSDTLSKRPGAFDKEKVMVNGIEYPRYPTPDVSTYSYDEATGYYYDTSTQLYYDSSSQYYLNAKTNKYVYWSPDHHTFLPAPESTADVTEDKEATANGNDKKKDPSDKKDKVKTAKRIAKDMEKWAKTLNQKAAKAQQHQPLQQQPPQAAQQQMQQQVQAISIGVTSAPLSIDSIGGANKSTEDVAFSMLQSKNDREPMTAAAVSSSSGLARLTGYGSDDDEDDNAVVTGSMEEQQLTDWSKLACLLCKRQFPSRDKLTKHNEKSDLHRSNLESWRNEQTESGSSQGGQSASGGSMLGGSGYRDRAKERRQKYGLDDEGPRPNRLKEKYLAAMEEAEFTHTKEPKKLDSSNIGSKMLQRMGWKEGLGLGKSNQGRTTIIEAEGNRNSQAGLGSSGGGGAAAAKANPNESYKDSVKRTLFQRYHELHD